MDLELLYLIIGAICGELVFLVGAYVYYIWNKITK